MRGGFAQTLKRLTWQERGLVQFEMWFTYKPEADRPGIEGAIGEEAPIGITGSSPVLGVREPAWTAIRSYARADRP